MNDKRLAQLRDMQAADPDDPFFPYAIAQEYISAGEHQQAQEEFSVLMARFPDYLPSYYHAGLNLYQLGRAEEATACLRTGIALAQTQGERKTANELRELLEDIE
jgi:tetratricopeptide (TPR) repeat protein